jgi:hypothetical protein
MPRFYFHLSNSDECLRDDIGRDLTDLAAAHTSAKRLARRVMKVCGLASYEPDWRHLTVTVTDDHQGPILTVIVRSIGDGHRLSVPRLFSPRFNCAANECGATLITYPGAL